jgi:hypothetical protein
LLELNKLHKSIPYSQYHFEPGLRSSVLKHMMTSAKKARFEMDNLRPATPAMQLGSLLHLGAENPSKFMANMVVPPDVDRRTKAGKEAIAQFESNLKLHQIVVRAEWAPKITGMLNSLLNHPIANRMLSSGIAETSLFTEDDATGQILKCRPDFITAEGHMVDLKTTNDPRPSVFLRRVYGHDFFYALQAAHYAHCAKLSKRANGDSFIFIAIESDAPFDVVVYALNSGDLYCAEEWRAKLTKQHLSCVSSGLWPGISDSVQCLPVPQWAKSPDISFEGEI